MYVSLLWKLEAISNRPNFFQNFIGTIEALGELLIRAPSKGLLAVGP